MSRSGETCRVSGRQTEIGRGKEEHRKDKMVTEERKHQENAGKAEKKERDGEGEKGKMTREEKRVEIRKKGRRRRRKKKGKKKGRKGREKASKIGIKAHYMKYWITCYLICQALYYLEIWGNYYRTRL